MKLFITALLLSIFLFSCGNDEYDWIDRTKHAGLLNLNASEKFETYATESNPENIKVTVENLEFAKSYYDNIFNENLNFAVLFIDNENWDKYAFSPPPGMPQAYYKGNMVLGLGKSVMAMQAEEGLNYLPEQSINMLKKYFGDDIDLDKFFRDGLALHELGHLYQFYRTSNTAQRRWLNELFGNLCQVGAAKSFKDPKTFNQMNSYQNILNQGNQWGNLKYTTLEQFENNYFDIMKAGRNYGWYQTKFFTIAIKLHEEYGDEIISKFREFLITSDPANFGKVGDDQLKDMLLNKFGPEVMKALEWNASN